MRASAGLSIAKTGQREVMLLKPFESAENEGLFLMIGPPALKP